MGATDWALIAVILALIALIARLNTLISLLKRVLKRFDAHPTDPRTNPRKPTWKS